MRIQSYNYLVVLALLLLPLSGVAQEEKSKIQGELTFEKYLKEVGERNLSFLGERYELDIAQAGIVAARVFPDPELEFEGGEEYYSLELSYNLELGNKRGNRIRLAKREAEGVQLELEAFFQDLRSEAADAYLDAILQRELLSVKRNSYEKMIQLSMSDSLRFALGEITENDARQSKLEAATLLNEVYQQEAAYKSALALLNRYMGRGMSELYTPKGSWSKLERAYQLADLIELAKEHRVELKIAQHGTAVSSQLLKSIRAERRLDLGLMVGYERDWHGLFPNKHTLKGGVTVPLKLSNTNRGSVRAGRFALEQKRIEEQNRELELEVEVSKAYYLYESAQRQVSQYRKGLLEESAKVLQGMVYRYKRGETSILEVLIAQRTNNEVQEQYLSTLKEYGSALIHLERTCGIWDISF